MTVRRPADLTALCRRGSWYYAWLLALPLLTYLHDMVGAGRYQWRGPLWREEGLLWPIQRRLRSCRCPLRTCLFLFWGLKSPHQYQSPVATALSLLMLTETSHLQDWTSENGAARRAKMQSLQLQLQQGSGIEASGRLFPKCPPCLLFAVLGWPLFNSPPQSALDRPA
ncbi:hypothetical protein B0T25DRAFT_118013 [Lasiosphaeria hispida]|uniref:Uncharacterized protein n=1 Tax=Lasiosphaeria hispida TaxID=260671 RepID=A0AAJ0HRG2_9PEZI|nr:hypothetical protein B0T25DRAFT_118013 [Lasiosphaeria hispida]